MTMVATGFTLFDTAIGRCGVAWNEHGVSFVQLPERSDAETRARLARSCGGAPEAAPPPDVARAIAGMTSLVAGEPIDLTGVQIDLSKAPSFHQRVYEITRAIPPGHTRTYGEIASELGDLSASRAVGQALGRNPVPLIVPCHRVLAAAGRSGGFSANGGVALKHELLAIEGALPREGTLDF
jgi:methylated-DNA-[protein]-cysteine S-methyltransferase